MGQPHFIVFANEKGGTGKSTTAVHTAIALAASGHRVGALDLDQRQRTMTRYLENRDATMRRLDKELAARRLRGARGPERGRRSTPRSNDFGRVPRSSSSIRPAATIRSPAPRSSRPTRLVTPMNDSFVDLDLIGQVHPENYKVTKPSFYAELIWNSRTQRAKATGKSVDWVVLGTACSISRSHNLHRVGAALDELARRVGFRVIPGLGERVIYRELFPKGLTLLDLADLGEVGLGHIAARQELREMIAGLGHPRPGRIERSAQGGCRGLIFRQQGISMSHQFNRTILREYDVRGIVGSTLNPDDAYALGRSYAALATSEGAKRVAVGRDGRTHSPELEAALVDGLPEGGLDVVRIGMGPSPMLYFAVATLDVRAASRSPAATTRPITTASRCC